MRYAVATARAATSREDFADVVQTVWSYDRGAKIIRTALKLMAYLYPRPGPSRIAGPTHCLGPADPRIVETGSHSTDSTSSRNNEFSRLHFDHSKRTKCFQPTP